MDCLRLLESLDHIGYSGICIGVENSQLLQNSLLILQQENHFRKCYYWGRINGAKKDYYIAYGYVKDCLKSQVFYYSFDCLNWLLMPKPNKCGRFLAPLAVTIFEGDPTVVTNVYNWNPPFPPNEDPEKNYEGVIPKELKEEDRLAAVVEHINEDAMVVPRGSWYKNTSGDIMENLSFEGLSYNESQRLNSYLHARLPQRKWNTNLLTRPDYNYSFDFLDTVDEDVPKECWSLQTELGGNLVILKNTYWPGMTFYHKINSQDFGFMYAGSGKKNFDLQFMV